MKGWLTPDAIPVLPACFRVEIPDTDETRRAFYGALMSLGEVWNWEKFGTSTPEQTAQAWQTVNIENIPIEEPCMLVGMIFLWPAGQNPSGALLCDGQLIGVDDYPGLYNILGYSWGGTPGFDFAVPDLIDSFPLMVDANVGDTGGETDHTLTVNEMPEHRHGIKNMKRENHGIPVGTHDVFAYEVDEIKNTLYEGGDAAHNNMPPYVKLRPFIVAG